LFNLAIPGSLNELEDFSFSGCGVTNLVISAGVKTIGTAAFTFCGQLAKVILPETVTKIGGYGFGGCVVLSEIVIPSSVTNLATNAFFNCYSLTNVYFKGNAPVPADDLTVFQYVTNATAFYLPSATGWSSTFDGLPTSTWLPKVRTDDGSLGLQNNQFAFNIFWARNEKVVVEACTNLTNPIWTPVATNSLAGDSLYFGHVPHTIGPARFYRLIGLSNAASP